MSRLYLSPPHMGGDERRLLADAFDSNWIAPLGPHVDAFEREFAGRSACRTRRRSPAGTAALHLALRILGVGRGRRGPRLRRSPSSATANPIVYQGARPVFIDSSRETWNMDPALLEEELERAAPARQAAQGGHRRSTSTGSAPTTTRSPRPASATACRCRGRRRGARRDLQGARRPAPSARWASSPSTATRSSPPAAAGCSLSDRKELDRAGALPRHAGARPGAALPALRARLQLPA